MTAQAEPQTSRAFALSGFLLALLGAILPGWNYHVTEQHAAAGWLFFALAAGVFASGEMGRGLLRGVPAKFLRLAGCALAAAALLILNLLPSPIPFGEQSIGWLAIGFAAGLINFSLSELIHDGIYFSAGCLASAVLVAMAIRWGYFAQILGLLAIAPFLFGLVSLKVITTAAPPPEVPPSLPLAFRDFSAPGAITLTALLLIQSGSEWTVAGWLPLFLTHRLGISPETALWMLALYWLALLLGRITNSFLLARASHGGRILFMSAAAALLGCIFLVATDNLLGAAAAILLLGGGFAAVHPLLAEKMGSRSPRYHPTIFKTMFSLALAGGLLFPWFAGLLAERLSLTAILAIPAIGVFLVVALLLVLWLESKVTGR